MELLKPGTVIDFMRYRRGFGALSLALGIAGLVSVFFPGPNLCTDNAAMIAAAGAYYLEKGISSKLDLNAVPYLGI